ncbi:protealysin inhibitor emfourin [Streptomyces sp. NPDC094448]|uniref:protealysin inhibitor emfourin n=1 Tax=Streptomyces sp. NPDC094448 TaxID=3366063 RepID=UPI003824FB8F
MQIHVRRTGGFAGIERSATVDTTALPDAAEWSALAREAAGDGDGGRTGPLRAGVPDGFAYEITVDGRTVHAAEPGLTAAQRKLVSRVLREGA